MQLILTIDTQSFRAYEWKDKTLSKIKDENFNALNQDEAKSQFQTFISSITNIGNYDEVSCSFFDSTSSLIPDTLFSVSTAVKLLEFDQSKEVIPNEVDYNRLAELKSVLIYWMPLWVKSVLIPKFPRAVILHEQSFGLRVLAQKSPVFNTVQVILHPNNFSLQFYANQQLKHNSAQEMQSIEDVLYHIVNCFERLEINSKTRIFLYAESEEARKQITELKTLILRYKTDFEIECFDSQTDHLIFHTLCV